jgi:hypothetical protein
MRRGACRALGTDSAGLRINCCCSCIGCSCCSGTDACRRVTILQEKASCSWRVTFAANTTCLMAWTPDTAEHCSGTMPKRGQERTVIERWAGLGAVPLAVVTCSCAAECPWLGVAPGSVDEDSLHFLTCILCFWRWLATLSRVRPDIDMCCTQSTSSSTRDACSAR